MKKNHPAPVGADPIGSFVKMLPEGAKVINFFAHLNYYPYLCSAKFHNEQREVARFQGLFLCPINIAAVLFPKIFERCSLMKFSDGKCTAVFCLFQLLSLLLLN